MYHSRETMLTTLRDAARERFRRFTFALFLGAATVVWPGGPGSRDVRMQPPPYERALRWSDIIRLRLSWLLSFEEPSGVAPPRR